MHRGSKKEEEVTGTQRCWKSHRMSQTKAWLNFSSLMKKEEWVVNINKYSKCSFRFFWFQWLGFFFSFYITTSHPRKQSYFTISSWNTRFAPLLCNYMKETQEFTDSVKGQRADTWMKSGSKFIIMHISGLSTLQALHLIPAVEQC